MKHKDKGLHSGIKNFGQEVSKESARSIELLKQIDITISALNRLTAQLHADAHFADKLMSDIELIKCEIDIDNEIASKLEKAQLTVYNVYNELKLKRKSGRSDPRLLEEDGIEDSYTEAITAAAELQNKLNDLRWNLLEHDADLSTSSKTYTNAQELIRDLVA